MGLARGDRLGPYEILAPLGAGGMGDVYKAQDTRLGREVAIKVSKSEFSERFAREARAAAALHHPHICTLFDVGPDYLVMELIEGVPLKGPLPQADALHYAAQIADALEHAHQRGVVHRDLKPANILITPQGIKLLDFGLARITPAPEDATLTMTQAGAVMGTPAYMAPEQWAGQTADARADIYAFGCVLYEMIMGRRVQEGRRRLDPPALESVVAKCLQPDPAARYQSASELRQALAGVQKGGWFKREYAIVTVAIVMLLVGLGLLMMEFPSRQRLTDKDVLVLADFNNTTGDAIFDGTLRAALAIQIEQSPFLKIMDDEQVVEDLKLMGRPADARITPAIAHDICVREGQKAMLGGSVANLGRALVVTVQAVNCQNGTTLAREQVQAQGREQVLNAISKAATGIRAKLGESLASIQKLDRPLEQVTTGSIEAFRAYALGRAQTDRGQPREAIPFFVHATELDPSFAMAYLMAGLLYGNAGEQDRSLVYEAKAYALIDRVSQSERFNILDSHYRATGEVFKAIGNSQLWARTYPRYWQARNSLGLRQESLGEFEKAVGEFEQAAVVAPKMSAAVANLITGYIKLDQFDRAKAIAKESNAASSHLRLLQIASITSDAAAARAETDWLRGKNDEYLSLGVQAPDALMHGQFKKAAVLDEQGARLARQQELRDAARQIEAQVASREEWRGNCQEVQEIGAVAALLCGDTARPLGTAEAEGKQRPDDTLLNAVRLPAARAAVAIAKNQPAQAIELLESAAPYERAYSQVPYLRGIAYLGLSKGAEAAAEFQKVLDHKGANWGIVYSLSYLGAGRAWAIAGDSVKAKKAYEDFFALWKDADADLPVLARAKQEYAAIR